MFVGILLLLYTQQQAGNKKLTDILSQIIFLCGAGAHSQALSLKWRLLRFPVRAFADLRVTKESNKSPTAFADCISISIEEGSFKSVHPLTSLFPFWFIDLRIKLQSNDVSSPTDRFHRQLFIFTQFPRASEALGGRFCWASSWKTFNLFSMM